MELEPPNPESCRATSGSEAEIAGIFPVSCAQDGLWVFEQLHPNSPAYNLPQAWRLEGTLHVEALQWSLDELVRRHESLRTAIVTRGSQRFQVVQGPRPFPFKYRTLSAAPHSSVDLKRLVAEEVAAPFALNEPPLARAAVFQVSTTEHVLVLTLHHIVSDAWSQVLLLRELGELYTSRLRSRPAALKEPGLQFVDFSEWQRGRLDSQARAGQLQYWTAQLAPPIPFVTFPEDRIRPASQTFHGAVAETILAGSTVEPLRQLARTFGTTLFVCLLTAFKVLLRRSTDQDDIVVGTTFAQRDRPELEDVTGFLVNVQALRADFAGNPSFTQVLSAVRRAVLGALENQDVSIQEIAQALRIESDAARHPLFQVLFGMQAASPDVWEWPGLRASRVPVDNGCAKFDLSLLASELPNGLRLYCEYSTDLYERSTIERLLRRYEVLLSGIAENPGRRISELPVLSHEEHQQVLEFSQGPCLPWPQDMRLHECFEQQARRSPEATAVIHGTERVSYAELNLRADYVAAKLIGLNLGADARVALCMQRSVDMIAAILAVLKSGAAYVPLDPAYPADRLAFVLADSGAALVLTDAASARFVPSTQLPVLHVERLLTAEASAGNPPSGSASDLAYVIYTSGSTGQPKGVALEHRNAAALLAWARQQFGPEELHGVLAATSICFDLSVFEIFVPLSAGGTVILADNALTLPGLPAAQEVTLINTVPSAIEELLRLRAIPESVQVINLAGEPLSQALVERLYAETRAQKVYDLYGPTETTTYSTGALRRPGEAPTIGKPLPNEQVYLLDREQQPVPAGCPGEIYIGGVKVARGYLNRPDLTAERFVGAPWASGARLYKTGDLARWRPDGTLQFLGRRDHQVKVRGYRIELGEIESVLKTHTGISETVVIAREQGRAGLSLIAYVVGREPAPGVDECRAWAEQKLPGYMVPSRFVFVPQLPLTPNGKVDRAALPEPEAENRGASPSQRTPTESVLEAIWCELLAQKSISPEQNFFHLGGHSLLATQVTSRAADCFNVELPVRLLFEAPTLSAYARAVDALCSGEHAVRARLLPRHSSASEAAALLAKLESLSDEEVERLLQDPQLGTLTP